MSRINKERIFDLGCSIALELMGVTPTEFSCSGIEEEEAEVSLFTTI